VNKLGVTASEDLNSKPTTSALPDYLQQILKKLGLFDSQGKDTKAIK